MRCGWLGQVPRSAPLLGRRALLGAALGGLAAPALTACTGSPFEPEPPAPVPPDVRAAERAAERERELLAAYDAALVLAPQLADRLLPLRGDHAAHLAALGLPEQPPPPPEPPSLPQDPVALLAALADLERRTATAHASAAVLGGRGVAAVLASAAASESAHVVALA